MDYQRSAREVLSAISGQAEVDPEQDLVADLGIDSVKALELLVKLEEAWGVEISDEDAARMTTVGDVLEYAGALAG